MAQTALPPLEPTPTSPASPVHGSAGFLRKWFGRSNASSVPSTDMPRSTEPARDPETTADDISRTPDMMRHDYQVVPGLPRTKTFKRQQSEKRYNLAPVQPSPDERRAVSVDRRAQQSRTLSQPANQTEPFPRTSAPGLLDHAALEVQSAPSAQASPRDEKVGYSLTGMVEESPWQDAVPRDQQHTDAASTTDFYDAQSITTSLYDQMIHNELERTWILNLSMHFRDKSKREKFFVTYREPNSTCWRRVTISLDYRNAPDNSLEIDLATTKFQRDKNAKIYEAIRESLQDIQFYDTVTNLKLQTTDGRLHVHVVEDTNEIIPYPPVRQVQHLGCRRIRESEIGFDSHMSGFVYKVQVQCETLIKKEIPGPDTIDEFLYEINALNRLKFSSDVIRFYGLVVDDQDEIVKGLLISYADQGAVIDVLYDNRQDSESGTPWPVREKWARQIVQGLADIHESGFVQGDFTLSNIVIDDLGDAKIIDINRRGCPVGWEPPEATSLIECGQRISMYIGVKSDLYQLGMVLWALATQEDEPEAHSRPLLLRPELNVPAWYRDVVYICLSDDPRLRRQAASLLAMFPSFAKPDNPSRSGQLTISADDGQSLRQYPLESHAANGQPLIRTVHPTNEFMGINTSQIPDPFVYTRGRSPPSPLPSHHGQPEAQKGQSTTGWADAKDIASSYSDVGCDEMNEARKSRSVTPRTSKESLAAPEPMADTYPAVLIEKPIRPGEEESPDPLFALTPESMAVEHHVHDRGSRRTAVTPTPGRIEDWAREASESVLGQDPDAEETPRGDDNGAQQREQSAVPSVVAPAACVPFSPPVDDETAKMPDVFSQPVLEPVPDDLPRLDETDQAVESAETSINAPNEPTNIVIEEPEPVQPQEQESVTLEGQGVPSQPAPEVLPETTSVEQTPSDETVRAVETAETTNVEAADVTEPVTAANMDMEAVQPAIETHECARDVSMDTGTGVVTDDEFIETVEPTVGPELAGPAEPVDDAATADLQEATKPETTEVQQSIEDNTATMDRADDIDHAIRQTSDLGLETTNTGSADLGEVKDPATSEVQEGIAGDNMELEEPKETVEVLEQPSNVVVEAIDTTADVGSGEINQELQDGPGNETGGGAADGQQDAAAPVTAADGLDRPPVEGEKDGKEEKGEPQGITDTGPTVPEDQIENSNEPPTGETETSAIQDLPVDGGEEASKSIFVEESKPDTEVQTAAEVLDPETVTGPQISVGAEAELQAGDGELAAGHVTSQDMAAALEVEGAGQKEASLNGGSTGDDPATEEPVVVSTAAESPAQDSASEVAAAAAAIPTPASPTPASPTPTTTLDEVPVLDASAAADASQGPNTPPLADPVSVTVTGAEPVAASTPHATTEEVADTATTTT